MNRTTLRPCHAALIAALCVLVAACGTGAADNPALTAERFYHAVAERDVDRICSLVAADGQPVTEEHQWSECQSGMHYLLSRSTDEQIAKYANAEVTSATIDGDSARVGDENVTGVLDPDFDLELIRLDGKWYISSFGD